MSLSRLLPLLLATTALACFSDPVVSGDTSDDDSTSGDGDTNTGDGDGDTGDGDTGDGDGDTGSGACDPGMTCADPVPAGWNGPVVLAESEGAVECPSEFPSLVQELHSGLSAESAECGCECGEPGEGITCTATLIEGDPGCDLNVFMPEQWQVGQDDCVPISTDTTAFAAIAESFAANDSTCEPLPTQNVPEATWASNMAVCEIMNPDECSVGGLCLPDIGAPTCIWVEGDTDCPAGPYETQVIRYAAIDDTRECSECTCGPPEGTCVGSIDLLTAGCGIMGLLQGAVDLEVGCTDIGGVPTFADYKPVHDGACPPTGGEPVGDAQPGSSVTFCCTQ